MLAELVLATVLAGPYRFLPDRVEKTSVKTTVRESGDCSNGQCSSRTRKVFSGRVRSRLFRRFR